MVTYKCIYSLNKQVSNFIAEGLFLIYKTYQHGKAYKKVSSFLFIEWVNWKPVS